MNLQNLIDALDNLRAKEIQSIFNVVEGRSKDISSWVEFFCLPKDETYSIQISHKIRNTIMSGLNYHFGVKHLDNQKFPGLSEMDFKEALNYIDQMLLIKDQLNFINPIINRMLYPKD